MISWVKKIFIPGIENNYQPQILRFKSALVLAGAVLVIEFLLFFSSTILLPKTGFLAAILPDAILQLTNMNRTAQGATTLSYSSLLTQAAQFKSQDMAQKSYFSHINPEGKDPWYWLSQVGYSYEYAGENLAIHFFDSQELMQAWLNSTLHKANILNPHYTETGIAFAQGTYEGKETTFIVQFFGKPLITSPLSNLSVVATSSTEPEITSANVLGESIAPAETSTTSGIAPILSSPKSTAQVILSAFFGFLVIAFLLNIGIHITKQFPFLIANGAILLLLIALALALNSYLLLSQGKIG